MHSCHKMSMKGYERLDLNIIALTEGVEQLISQRLHALISSSVE